MQVIFLYLLTVVIWGSTWFAINFQLGTVAHEVSISYRFLLASVILFAYCKGRKLPLSFNFNAHLRFLGLAITLFAINYLFMYQAQTHIISALSSIAFSTLLIMNIVNSRIFFRTPISTQTYLGGLLGLFGIVALYFPQVKTIDFGDSTLLGLGLCLVGTFSASLGNMISIKNQQIKLPVMQTNAWGMLYGGLFMAIIALVQGQSFNVELTTNYLGSLLYLALFGSVIGFGCYLTLLGKIGAQKTSYANILFPAVAVVFSTLFEGFLWTTSTVVGFSCIVLGNLIVLYRRDLFKAKKSS